MTTVVEPGAPSEAELVRIVEAAEVAAWTDAVRAGPPAVNKRLGLRIEPIAGGVALITTEIANLLYNRVFGFGLDTPLDPATIDRMIALFRRDHPFSIQPCPAVQPPGVREWLEARGMHAYFNWVKWVRDASAAPEVQTDLVVDAIGRDLAPRFIELTFQIFTEPSELGPWLIHSIGRGGWTHYMARDGMHHVGVAALYVRNKVGWLGWGGMLPSHRGRGGQSAMLARRIHDAAAKGCRWLTVETAEDLPEKPSPSYRNVQRAGFRVLYLRPSHAHVPPEHAPRLQD